MELHIFVRFHARAGAESEAEAALGEVVPLSRAEPGCLSIQAFRSTGDPRLYYIHSIWRDEAAFDLHATLPHTVRFLARMDAAIDEPREVTRARIVNTQ